MSPLQQRINDLPWFHQIDFGDGVLSPGATPIDVLRTTADVYFKDELEGRTFIDVGCWDGFNSFEAKRRGAARVLATDHFAWSDRCWGSRESFDLARENLGLDVDVLDIDLADITAESVGKFDVVLFAGVLYHVRHPLQALEQMSTICDQTLIVETHLDALDLDPPAMIFYPTDELGKDATNWWGPNPACVNAMLKDVGFSSVEFAMNPAHSVPRGIFHAHR